MGSLSGENDESISFYEEVVKKLNEVDPSIEGP